MLKKPLKWRENLNGQIDEQSFGFNLIDDLIEMSISSENNPPLNHCEYLSYAWTIFDLK